MIKVIASDLDGTLLDVDHKLNKRTAEIIRQVIKAGIRFIVATGRNYEGVIRAFNGEELVCDYILNSGAEVRNPQKEILFSGIMKLEDCRTVHKILQKYNTSYIFCGTKADYCIGNEEEMERNIIEHVHTFNQSIPIEQIKESETYHILTEKTKAIPDFDKLIEMDVKLIKVFVFSNDIEMLGELKKELVQIPGIAVASSFYNNLEITDIAAQKGPVLKKYIEDLGYTMDEVMVFGDSLNDYSMLSMDFGATIAMENADPEIKKVSKYVTKSNSEDGVAYALTELLKLVE